MNRRWKVGVLVYDIWIGFPNTVWGKYVANEHQPTNQNLEQNGWHVFIV